MDAVTVKYRGNRYAGVIDSSDRPIFTGSYFEATGPTEAFHITEGSKFDYVKVLDKDMVIVKEYEAI